MQTDKTADELWIDTIKKYYPTFNKIFQSEQDLIDCSLGFRQIYKDNGEAMFEFFSLSEYMLVLNSIKDDFVKLIMVTSVIKKLNSKKEYMTFTQWLSQRKQTEKQENINKLWNDYNIDFGCSGKFRKYFQNLKEQEQVELLTTIQFFQNVNGNNEPVPLFCYDNKDCSDKVNLCVMGYVFPNCPVLNDKKRLNDSIKELSEFLYTLRNRFVHDAVMPHFSESSHENTVIPLLHYIPYEFKYISQPNYSGNVWLRLRASDLENKVRRDFKSLLLNFIKTRKEG